MFLNIYLFLLNIIIVSFCSIYLKNLYLDKSEFEKIKKNMNNYKKNKNIIKKDYNEQLKYIRYKTDCNDIENNYLLYWKVFLFLVVIFSTLTIVLTEPISIFGVHFRYMTSLLILLVNFIFLKILKKIGVKL
jgi:uncharacterized membrane protein (DUF106 family)